MEDQLPGIVTQFWRRGRLPDKAWLVVRRKLAAGF
jgi:hypothetical protein